MHNRSDTEQRTLCTIELIANDHAARCPGDACAFWDQGCVLSRVEVALAGRPEVAHLLLELRHELEAGRAVEIAHARSTLARILNEDDELDAPL